MQWAHPAGPLIIIYLHFCSLTALPTCRSSAQGVPLGRYSAPRHSVSSILTGQGVYKRVLYYLNATALGADVLYFNATALGAVAAGSRPTGQMRIGSVQRNGRMCMKRASVHCTSQLNFSAASFSLTQLGHWEPSQRQRLSSFRHMGLSTPKSSCCLPALCDRRACQDHTWLCAVGRRQPKRAGGGTFSGLWR